MKDNNVSIDYFGVCPTCKKSDGYINIGKGHWFYCREHKVRWFVGSNLFSSWRDETEEEQHAQYAELGMGDFWDVVPLEVSRLASEADQRWSAKLPIIQARAGLVRAVRDALNDGILTGHEIAGESGLSFEEVLSIDEEVPF